MIYLQKCKISIFFVIFAQLCPLCGVHAHALLEGKGECTVCDSSLMGIKLAFFPRR